MNKDGKVKLIKLSISEAYEEYRNVQNIDGVRASTLDRVDNSMKTLYKVFGESYPIESFKYSPIEQCKEYWHGTHQPTSMKSLSIIANCLGTPQIFSSFSTRRAPQIIILLFSKLQKAQEQVLLKVIIGRNNWLCKYFKVRILNKSKPQNIISNKKVTR
jgi:hypothetical protein